MAQHTARILPFSLGTLGRVWRVAVPADQIVLPANETAFFEGEQAYPQKLGDKLFNLACLAFAE